MTWLSDTHQFSANEMEWLEKLSVEDLAAKFLEADPIVVLRALTEIMLHEDPRLEQLLAMPEINEHWQHYLTDYQVTPMDLLFAKRMY
jgi:hypothetical protein